MAGVVSVKFDLELFYKVRALRARADNAHIAFKDIHELRELIEIEPAQKSSYGGGHVGFGTAA